MSTNETINELIKAFVTIKNTCVFPQCNINCPFFILGGGCYLRGIDPPTKWVMPQYLINNLHAQTLEKVKEASNETVVE